MSQDLLMVKKMLDEGIRTREILGPRAQKTIALLEKLVPLAQGDDKIAQALNKHFQDFGGSATDWNPDMLNTKELETFKYPPAAFLNHHCDRKDQTFLSEEQRTVIDSVTAAMGGRQVQQNGEVVVTKHDMMMIALSDSVDSTSGSLCVNGNGAIQSNEGASGMKAQSAPYAAGLKAYNPDCRSIYAKICPGGTLENLLDELVAYFGEDICWQLKITLC